MFRKIWYTFFMIYNASRIPKLPRMLATDYKDIPGETRYVMRRLGCRDPRGVDVAMKHYGVKTVQELVDILEYQQPKRNIKHRLWLAVGRVVGGMDKEPHQDEIRRETRRSAKTAARDELRQRIKTVQEMLK